MPPNEKGPIPMKKLTTMILAGALSLSLTAPALAAGGGFSDVPTTHWAYTAIEQAADKGWVSGVGGGKFAPGGTLSNAQFLVMAVRANLPSEAKGLTPKQGEEWWEPYMDLAEANGFLEYTGITNTAASANKPISREVMAQVIANTATYNMLVTEISPDEMDAVKASVKDWGKVEWEHQTAVGYCYNKGILSGKSGGMFAPDDTLTRAEAAVVLTRAEAAFELVLGENWRGDSDYVQNVDPVNPGNEGQNKPVNPGEGFVNVGSEAESLANGKPATEANVLALIKELKVKYPDGSKYDPNTSYHSAAFDKALYPKYSGSLQCAKLAFMLSDEVWGDLPVRTHKDITKIRPGDVVEYKDSVHWSFAMSTPEPDIYDPGYYAVDVISGGAAGIVGWSVAPTGKILGLEDDYTIYTRYPD